METQEYEMVIRSEDGTHEQAVMLEDWQRKLNQASRIFGKQMNVASDIAGWMRETGFVNVSDDTYKVVPILWHPLASGSGLS